MSVKAYIAVQSKILARILRVECLAIGVEAIFMREEKALEGEIAEVLPGAVFMHAALLENLPPDFLPRLRSDPRLENPRLIAVGSRDEGARAVRDLGADLYLQVPFSKEQFASFFRSRLGLPRKVLLATEEAAEYSSLCRALIALGFEIHRERALSAALGRALALYPDLLLCGEKLSAGDGVALCGQIRSQSAFSSLPIYLLSGGQDPELVERALEAGASEVLLQPFDSEENIRKFAASPCPRSRPGRRKILVVDDNSMIRNLITKMLKQAGYEILTANDGEEGLKAAMAEIPDLITSDYDMPNMDGWRFCRELKKSEATRDIPIVMVSARDNDLDLKKGATLGVLSYLTKPFTDEQLLETMATALERSKQARERKRLTRHVADDATPPLPGE